MARATAEPRRSAWRVLVPPLLVVLLIAVALGTYLATGAPDLSALMLTGGIGLIALWALIDGLRRAAGKTTYLGTGRGVDRLAGVFQVLASVGVAIALLPNSVALLNVLVGLLRAPAP